MSYFVWVGNKKLPRKQNIEDGSDAYHARLGVLPKLCLISEYLSSDCSLEVRPPHADEPLPKTYEYWFPIEEAHE